MDFLFPSLSIVLQIIFPSSQISLLQLQKRCVTIDLISLASPSFALSYLFITARIRNVCKQLFCSSNLRFDPCCRRGFSCFDILTLSHLGFQLCLKKISRTNYSCIYKKIDCLFFCLQDPPGPIDNSKITVNKNGHFVLKQGT